MTDKKTGISRIRTWFSGGVSDDRGVSTFTSPRFFAVLLFYLASFIILALDPFFQRNGIFVYRQGIVTVFFAFVITAALNWEMLLFGRASGGNLLLQIMQLPPLTLLLARLIAFPSKPVIPSSLAEKVKQFVMDADKALFDIAGAIPDWLRDLFSNWRISLCFILVLMVLSCRNLRVKIATLISLLVIFLASLLEAKGWFSSYLVAGALLLGIGYVFQFCRYDRVIFFENAVRRIARTGTCDSLLASVMLSVLSDFYESGRVSRQQLLQRVQSVYAQDRALNGGDLQLIAGEIVRKMVYEFNLAEVHSNADGEFLAPQPGLFRYDNLLGMIAVVPRVMLTLVFCLLWILFPIDLIPDGIPFFGVLDDMTITLISCFVFQRSVPAMLASDKSRHNISQS